MAETVIACIITGLAVALSGCLGYWLLALKDYITEDQLDKRLEHTKEEIRIAREARFDLIEERIEANSTFWKSEHQHYKETVNSFADALKENTGVVSELKGELVSLRTLINQILLEKK